MTAFKKVHTFNKQIIGIDRPIISPMPFKEAKWLVNVLDEEVKEYIEAYEEGSLPGQVDALIDLMYFAIGGLVRLGLQPEQMEKCFDVVHSCNMNKTKGRKAREVTSDLDAVKSVDWEGPERRINSILEI